MADSRRDFIKRAGLAGIGLGVGPVLAHWLHHDADAAQAAARSRAVQTGAAEEAQGVNDSQ